MGVGPHDGHLLSLFGMHIRQGWGHTAYQVGSSLTQKKGWRDVDVRLMLPDDEYAALFGDPSTPRHEGNRRRMHELAWTTLGKRLTGLPIDFQIQDTSLANEMFSGVRSALIFMTAEEALQR